MLLTPCSPLSASKHVLLTIDVEDWFQVENFKPWITRSSWDARQLRVERNVHRLLDLFDETSIPNRASPTGLGLRQQASTPQDAPASPTNPPKSVGGQAQNSINQTSPCGLRPAGPSNSSNSTNPINSSNSINSTNPSNSSNSTNSIRATFFVLGWIARRLPHLVREMQQRGHEVASHGFGHTLCGIQPKKELADDLLSSKSLLEEITGAPVFGYRAPSFSIDGDVLKQIEACGYRYDSSYNSFRMHKRYGRVNLAAYPKRGAGIRISEQFYELPISNLPLRIKTARRHTRPYALSSALLFPWGGGGYFRMIPLPIFLQGVRYILRHQKAYIFYMHPWEIDPRQPKVNRAGAGYKFRHYLHLDKTYGKLKGLIPGLAGCRFVTCSEYLEEMQADSG